MILNKTSLIGNGVQLEPLAKHHLDGLANAIRDGELWKLKDTVVPHPNALEDFFQETEMLTRNGESLTYAIIDLKRKKVVGSTQFRKINVKHKKVTIGPTFIGHSWQRSHVNTEAKYLMLQHVFVFWAFNRVELLCDVNNSASRQSIRKLGAQEEGIIRHHRIMPDGRKRDSVVHSILLEDWLEVKKRLEEKMEQYRYRYALSA